MNTLVVIIGPTGVGKTEICLKLAEYYGSPIISADSRQIYKGLTIGTAAPTEKQLSVVPHYFVGTLDLDKYYHAAQYEQEVLKLTAHLFPKHPILFLTGGSMLYIDAVCKGIDMIPDVPQELRNELYERFHQEGLDGIRQELKLLDPEYYARVDLKNYKRVIHGLEVCLASGKPFSSFHTGKAKERPFKIIKIGLNRPREELFHRINLRVEKMIEDGLVNEAQEMYPNRNLNSLNTVGYKELFSYFDGEWNLETAIRKIQRNSRIYAKKQLTWFKKDPEIKWFHPDEYDAILTYLETLGCKNQ